jgi:hypothetical protein
MLSNLYMQTPWRLQVPTSSWIFGLHTDPPPPPLTPLSDESSFSAYYLTHLSPNFLLVMSKSDPLFHRSMHSYEVVCNKSTFITNVTATFQWYVIDVGFCDWWFLPYRFLSSLCFAFLHSFSRLFHPRSRCTSLGWYILFLFAPVVPVPSISPIDIEGSKPFANIISSSSSSSYSSSSSPLVFGVRSSESRLEFHSSQPEKPQSKPQ